MRIITEEPLKDYITRFPDTRTALQNCVKIVKEAKWECFADVKKSFNTVDNVGNQHYVFNIRGNNHSLVIVIKFTIKWVYIRFIGTHEEYDKIDCSTILRSKAMTKIENEAQYRWALARVEELLPHVKDDTP